MSNYKSNFNEDFKRNAIVNTRSPREHNAVNLNGLVKDLVKDLPKTTIKRNLPRTTSVSLKNVKIEYIFPRSSNGDI